MKRLKGKFGGNEASASANATIVLRTLKGTPKLLIEYSRGLKSGE